MRPKTIFCDIDGTLFHHSGDLHKQTMLKPGLLDGVKEKIVEWDRKGYNIILTTGRKESCRKVTEEQLAHAGIFYDQLVMGLGGGCRVLINDLKPNSETPTAVAINLERNKGVKNVEV
jgi:hypothetical protein